MKATTKQLALIHVAKAKLGLDDDTYRDILWVQAHVETAKDLDPIGVERVLKRFQELGFRLPGDVPKPGPKCELIQFRPAGHRPMPRQTCGELLPTSNQQALIRHLFEDLGWHDQKRRLAFTERQCGGRAFPNREQASALIECLKKMVKRGYSDRVAGDPAASSPHPPAP